METLRSGVSVARGDHPRVADGSWGRGLRLRWTPGDSGDVPAAPTLLVAIVATTDRGHRASHAGGLIDGARRLESWLKRPRQAYSTRDLHEKK